MVAAAEEGGSRIDGQLPIANCRFEVGSGEDTCAMNEGDSSCPCPGDFRPKVAVYAVGSYSLLNDLDSSGRRAGLMRLKRQIFYFAVRILEVLAASAVQTIRYDALLPVRFLTWRRFPQFSLILTSMQYWVNALRVAWAMKSAMCFGLLPGAMPIFASLFTERWTRLVFLPVSGLGHDWRCVHAVD